MSDARGDQPAWHVEPLVEGDGPQTIVMIHGWPDTLKLWDAQVQALRGRYRCVRFTLPGFDPAGPSRAFSLEEVLRCIAEVVDRTSPGKPVTMLLHDWGCFYGYLYASGHRDRVARVVGIDVGDAHSHYHRKELGLRETFGILSYQWWLALAWKIGGGLGDRLARRTARLTCRP